MREDAVDEVRVDQVGLNRLYIVSTEKMNILQKRHISLQKASQPYVHVL